MHWDAGGCVGCRESSHDQAREGGDKGAGSSGVFIHPIVTNLTTHHPLVHVMLLPLPYPVTNLQPIYVNSFQCILFGTTLTLKRCPLFNNPLPLNRCPLSNTPLLLKQCTLFNTRLPLKRCPLFNTRLPLKRYTSFNMPLPLKRWWNVSLAPKNINGGDFIH